MVITDDFIFIHFPKTGGTFATTMLDQALETCHKLSAKIQNNDKVPFTNEPYGQHGGYEQIPDGWSEDRTIFSIIRNPYDSIVSRYVFSWWKTNPIVSPDVIREKYPEFPDLSFSRYLEMANDLFLRQHTNNTPNLNIGFLSFQFLRFYFREPYRLIKSIDEKYIASKQYRQDMFNVQFLRMEKLNEELFNFLITQGYPPKKIAFIKDHSKIYPTEGGRTEAQKWQKYYTPELMAYVRGKEKLLFNLFPEYDVAATASHSLCEPRSSASKCDNSI